MSTITKCRTGCPTQDHANWGDCARDANLSITNPVISNEIKTTDKELDAYRNARKFGIQPATTKMVDIQKAVRVSDRVGKAAKA